jgi:phosphinothricin acetyltransferase
MEIRDARTEDLSGILSIYNEVIAHSTAIYAFDPVDLADRRAWFDARSASGYPVLVAVDGDGAVAGFSSFGDWRAPAGYAWTVEHSVHVRSDCRGQGLGGALVERLFPLARALGKHVMIGGVDAENAASLALHRRLGFEPVAHFRQVGRKFDRWLDLIFLQRRL